MRTGIHACLRVVLLPCVACLIGCSSQDFGSPGSMLTDVVDKRDAYIEREDELDSAARAKQLGKVLDAWQEQSKNQDRDYIVGTDDVVDIGILALDQPEEITTVSRPVGKDGTISLPLVGSQKVGGLTVREIKEEVTALYDGRYLRDPQITVVVSDYRSAPVVVTGAVMAPGIYYLRHNESSVLEVLALAEGLSEAAGRELMIVRSKTPNTATEPTAADGPPAGVAPVTQPAHSPAGETPGTESTPEAPAEEKQPSFLRRMLGSGDDAREDADSGKADPEPAATAAPRRAPAREATQEVITVSLERLLDEGDIRMNVPVLGGDVLSVPPRKRQLVFVLGYVQKPGAFEIPEDGNIRALQAVAMAGGLATSARAQNTFLITRSKKGEEVIPIDLTKITRGIRPPLYLEPGDTLVIGSSAIAKLAEFIRPSIGASATYAPVP